MPDFDPVPWNAPDPWDLTTPDSQPLNNCYDYATDNRTEWRPPMAYPVPNPEDFWSVPGRTKGVTPALARGALVFGATVKVLYEYTCEGVSTGAILDGLKKLEDDGSCDGDCWKVAYFIRPYNTTNGGDFHWARQDSDGGWSHKRGTGPVQRLDAPAPPSTTPAPEAENAVPGYEFCGYLCCCPDTRVAALPPEETEGAGETAMLAIFEGQSGSPLRIALGTEMASVFAMIEKATAGLGAVWEDGVGPGTLLYGLNHEGNGGQDRKGFLIADQSVTAFAGNIVSHVPDPTGRVAGLMREFISKAGGSPVITGLAPVFVFPVLAAITIGGEPLLPPGLVHTPQPNATIADGGTLPPDGCTWTLEIKVSTATIAVPGQPNCIYHVYKIETELVKICPGKTETFGETHITQTGPHCGDPNAAPPVPIPQPGTRSRLKSKNTKKKDGTTEVVIELPDGTEVTITTPPNGAPTVGLDYPNGSSGSFTLP